MRTDEKEPADSAPGDLTVPETDEDFTLGTEEHAVELTVPDDAEPATPPARAPAPVRDAAPDEPTALDVDLGAEDESRDRGGDTEAPTASARDAAA